VLKAIVIKRNKRKCDEVLSSPSFHSDVRPYIEGAASAVGKEVFFEWDAGERVKRAFW
jgi:hypothetical protein